MKSVSGVTHPAVAPIFLCRIREEQAGGLRQRFARDFIERWPARFEHLRFTLTTADLMGARAATQTLKTTSEMVGAEHLRSLVLELENELRNELFNATIGMPRLAATQLQRISQSGFHAAYVLRLQHPIPSSKRRSEGTEPERQPH